MTDRRSPIHRRFGPVAARRHLTFVCASLAIMLVGYPAASFVYGSLAPEVPGLRTVQWIGVVLGPLGLGLVWRMYVRGVAELNAPPAE